MKSSKNKYTDIFLIIFSLLSVYAVIWAFTGNGPFAENPYNSYVLQAKAWLSGSLDLGRNYEHLELAIYKGKYFVSFPPLPSVIMLPFAIFNIPDNCAAVFVSIAVCIYAWKLCMSFSCGDEVFLALFLSVASNVLVISINSWVWFIAQNLSLLFTLMSFYFAKNKNGTASLALLACAVLCRPFQAVYFPIAIYILVRETGKKPQLRWFAIPVILGIACMIFNYVRFDNPFEFGHNYLPEFMSAEKGQFDISYISENAKSLIKLPSVATDGRLQFPEFNGMSVFLCYPIVVFCLFYSLLKINKSEIIIGLLSAALHVLLILSHKTMGGWHFGNRYFADIMPCLFYMLLCGFPGMSRNRKKLMLPFFLFGLCLNLIGAVKMFG